MTNFFGRLYIVILVKSSKLGRMSELVCELIWQGLPKKKSIFSQGFVLKISDWKKADNN